MQLSIISDHLSLKNILSGMSCVPGIKSNIREREKK